MPDREPTIRSRELGEGLRRAMERAGINGKQAAYQLDLSPTLISRLLSDQRHATAMQAASFLAICRVKGPERDRLLALCDERRAPGWLQQHGTQLSQQLTTYIDHETKGSRRGLKTLRNSSHDSQFCRAEQRGGISWFPLK